MTKNNNFVIPMNVSIEELNAMLTNAITEGLGQDKIAEIATALTLAATGIKAKEDERTRIDNLMKNIAGHDYGEQATQILITRNLTPELKGKLAPPDEVVKFLKIYDLKVANGGTRICVSEKELKKCQKLLDSGRTLESIKHDEVVEAKKDKDGNPVKSEDTPAVENTDPVNAGVNAPETPDAAEAAEVAEATKPEDTETAES
jgi:hypothetical protein